MQVGDTRHLWSGFPLNRLQSSVHSQQSTLHTDFLCTLTAAELTSEQLSDNNNGSCYEHHFICLIFLSLVKYPLIWGTNRGPCKEEIQYFTSFFLFVFFTVFGSWNNQERDMVCPFGFTLIYNDPSLIID